MSRYFIIIMLLLISSCKPRFSTPAPESNAILEDMIHNALMHYASQSQYCRAEKINLVKLEETTTKGFVKALKEIKFPEEPGTSPELNLEPLKKFSNGKPVNTKPEVIMALIRGEHFSRLLVDTGDVLDKLAKDKNFTEGFGKILNTLSNDQKFHNKAMFMLKQLVDHPDQLKILIGAWKAIESKDPKHDEMTDLFYSPIALWEIGEAKFAGYGLALVNQLARPAEQVRRGWALVSFKNSQELIGAVKKSIGQAPDLDGLTRNVSVVLQVMEIPKKPFMNLLYKLYTMTSENHCAGEDLDKIGAHSVSKELKALAKMTSDPDQGLAKMLQSQ